MYNARGRITAGAGLGIMTTAALASITRMSQLQATTPFSRSDVLPALAVIAGFTALLLLSYLLWLKWSASRLFMIVVSLITVLCISNVELSRTIDGVTTSSQNAAGRWVAVVGAALMIIGAIRRRSARSTDTLDHRGLHPRGMSTAH